MLPILSEPVFVGRKQELNQLEQALQLAAKGHGKTIFVSGEAGSGKTRLINEFLKIAKDKDLMILSGWCLANAALPFFPFIEAFSSNVSNNGSSSLFSSNQQLSMKWLSAPYASETLENKLMVPQVWKDQAFASVTKELLFMSSVKPLILVLEDMHWADSASNALLHYISRTIASERILIIVTFRSEGFNNAEEKTNPFNETVHLMGREDLFYEIKLQNLNQANVRQLVESMLSGKAETQFVEELSRESQGNPLFVVESLRFLVENGGFVRENGKWQALNNKIRMPSKVKEIILRRLNTLKPDERRILDVASVIGERFDPELLGAVLAQDSLEVLEKLNKILKSTLLLRTEENCYTFNHAKSREVLYDEISLPLKQGYHARVAEIIENKNENTKAKPLSTIAYHYIQAGNIQKAIKYSLAAGQDALKRFSNVEAIEHFAFVQNTLDRDPSQLDERHAALEGLGDAYYANCMFEDAIKTYEDLANSGTDLTKVRAYRKEMEAIWYKEEDSSRLMELVEKAEKYASLDNLEKARILWNKGRAISWLGKMEEALNYHEQALKIFEDEYSLPDVAQAAFGQGILSSMIGLQDEKSVCQILRSIAIFRDLNDARGEMIAHIIGGGEGFLLCGLFQECYNNLTNAIKIGEGIGDFDNLAQAWWRLSDVPENAGNLAEAISQCLKALEYSKKTDTQGTQCKIYAKLAKLYALHGDLEKAEYNYYQLKEINPEIRHHPRNFFHIALPLSVFFAIKNQWADAIKYNEQGTEFGLKNYPNSSGLKFLIKKHCAWFLDKQAKNSGARMELIEANKILESIDEKFQHTNIQANLIVQKEVPIGREIEMRIDIINVGRKAGSIVKIEGLINPEFKTTITPFDTIIQANCLDLKEKNIDGFQVKTVKLKLQPTRSGSFNFSPRVFYINDLEEKKIAT